MQRLILIECESGTTHIDSPDQIKGIIKDYGASSEAMFETMLTEGNKAVVDWNTTVSNIFMVLVQQGIVDVNGFNLEGFGAGTAIHFLKWIREVLPVEVRTKSGYKVFNTMLKAASVTNIGQNDRQLKIDLDEMTRLMKPIGIAILYWALRNPDLEKTIGRNLQGLLQEKNTTTKQ